MTSETHSTLGGVNVSTPRMIGKLLEYNRSCYGVFTDASSCRCSRHPLQPRAFDVSAALGQEVKQLHSLWMLRFD